MIWGGIQRALSVGVCGVQSIAILCYQILSGLVYRPRLSLHLSVFGQVIVLPKVALLESCNIVGGTEKEPFYEFAEVSLGHD